MIDRKSNPEKAAVENVNYKLSRQNKIGVSVTSICNELLLHFIMSLFLLQRQLDIESDIFITLLVFLVTIFF